MKISFNYISPLRCLLYVSIWEKIPFWIHIHNILRTSKSDVVSLSYMHLCNSYMLTYIYKLTKEDFSNANNKHFSEFRLLNTCIVVVGKLKADFSGFSQQRLYCKDCAFINKTMSYLDLSKA